MFKRVIEFLKKENLGHQCPKMEHMLGGSNQNYDCDYIIDLGRKLMWRKYKNLFRFFSFLHSLYPRVPYANLPHGSREKIEVLEEDLAEYDHPEE